MLCGFSCNVGAPFGPRQGLAFYDFARGAFFNHQWDDSVTTTARTIRSCGIYKGQVFWVPELLHYTDPAQGYRRTGRLVTSVSDWNNAGMKTHDQTEIIIDPLPSTSQRVDVYYTTQDPRNDAWILASQITTVGATGTSFRLADIQAREFALKIELKTGIGPGSTTQTPVLKSYSVRSEPTDAGAPEWLLQRYVRILDRDRKNDRGPLVNQKPRDIRRALQDLLRDTVTWADEEDGTFTCRLEELGDFQLQSEGEQTQGTPQKNAYVMRLQLRGTRV